LIFKKKKRGERNEGRKKDIQLEKKKKSGKEYCSTEGLRNTVGGSKFVLLGMGKRREVGGNWGPQHKNNGDCKGVDQLGKKKGTLPSKQTKEHERRKVPKTNPRRITHRKGKPWRGEVTGKGDETKKTRHSVLG